MYDARPSADKGAMLSGIDLGEAEILTVIISMRFPSVQSGGCSSWRAYFARFHSRLLFGVLVDMYAGVVTG